MEDGSSSGSKQILTAVCAIYCRDTRRDAQHHATPPDFCRDRMHLPARNVAAETSSDPKLVKFMRVVVESLDRLRVDPAALIASHVTRFPISVLGM